jgi:hypothetical protein
MCKVTKVLMTVFIMLVVLNCGNSRKSHTANDQKKIQPKKTTPQATVKVPSPPIGYTIMENFSMSRGDFGIKVQVGKNLKKTQVMALAKYFQKFGIKTNNGRRHDLTYDGGLRMIHIYVPFPKNSKAKSKDVYVLKNDIRDLWF